MGAPALRMATFTDVLGDRRPSRLALLLLIHFLTSQLLLRVGVQILFELPHKLTHNERASILFFDAQIGQLFLYLLVLVRSL